MCYTFFFRSEFTLQMPVKIIEYTCKANGCCFQNGGSRIKHVEWCNRVTQERAPAVNLNVECVRRGCYIIKGPRPSADAIQHTHAVVPVPPRPIAGIWDFLKG